MAEVTRDDLLHLLATRHEMIEPLCEGGIDKRAIRRRLDVSRPTVDRAFRELDELGILDSTGSSYELTRFGRLFCDRFGDHIAEVEEMAELADLLAYLPEEASIDDRLLVDAAVFGSEPHAPLSPLSHAGEIVQEADRIEGYARALIPQYVSYVHRGVMEEGLEARVILPEPVMEVAFDEHMAELSELLDQPGFTLVKALDSVPYGILLVDDETVTVSIRDQENHLRGALVNDSPAAVEWARERLDALERTGEAYDFTRSGWSIRAD